MSSKLSMNLSDEGRTFLEETIEERGGNMTEHIHRALSVLRFIYASQRNGDEVFIKKSDGSTHKIQFLW